MPSPNEYTPDEVLSRAFRNSVNRIAGQDAVSGDGAWPSRQLSMQEVLSRAFDATNNLINFI